VVGLAGVAARGEAASHGFLGLRSDQGRRSLRPTRPGNGVGRRADLEHRIARRAGDPLRQVDHRIGGRLIANGVRLNRRDRDRAELHRLAVLLRPHRRRVVGRIARFSENGDEVERDRPLAKPLLQLVGIEVVGLRLEFVVAEAELARASDRLELRELCFPLVSV
jgi:hypothetical protein